MTTTEQEREREDALKKALSRMQARKSEAIHAWASKLGQNLAKSLAEPPIYD
ncbi:MAG: hypothetical protein JSR13_05955 [Proteobacteria bacterium]|nr:hypothetical protein [Pseudomonadota bacterium]